MWANQNKRSGGKDLGIDFALNSIPFGMGKMFTYLREGAIVAKNASKILLVGTYVLE